MSFVFALPEHAVARLRDALALGVESAWTATARVALDGTAVLARELRPVPDDRYDERGPRRLRIRSSGFMPAFTESAGDEQAVPVFVHTHPGDAPTPSALDETVDRELRALARSRTGRDGYASLIVGGTPAAPRITGRLWRADTEAPELLDRLRAAGPHLRVLLSDNRSAAESPAPMFDRHLRAFGPDGQRLLQALTIGVVGVGGTGSPTVEQLARLGVGRILVVDDDTIDETNLTRIHQAVHTDIDRLKVDVARNSGHAYGTGTAVAAIAEKAVTDTVIRQLAACDLIFGCTDDHAGRMVLSKIAYHYLVPVIDCGVRVEVEDRRIRGVFGRVTVVAPGTPCLHCRGQVNIALAAAEQMDPGERRRRAAEGYVPGIGDQAPAVVAFTTTTAGFAVSEMLARIFGFGSEPPPGQLLIGLHDRKIHAAGPPAKPGHYCIDASQWAQGDTNPPLGLTGIR